MLYVVSSAENEGIWVATGDNLYGYSSKLITASPENDKCGTDNSHTGR